MGVGGQLHALPTLHPGKKCGTHCTGGWVGPRASQDVCWKFPPPPEFSARTAQPVASRYTDYAHFISCNSVYKWYSRENKSTHTLHPLYTEQQYFLYTLTVTIIKHAIHHTQIILPKITSTVVPMWDIFFPWTYCGKL